MNHMKLYTAAILFFSLMSSNICGQSFTNNLDAYFEALTGQEKFSGIVLVEKAGETVYHKSYNYANREEGIPNNPEFAFRIGSVAKSFTAILIAKETERGTLSLDQTVSEFIPDYPRGNEITIKHLLSHTSGIVNYFAMLNDELYVEHQPMDLINYTRELPLNFEPGEGWDYSNTNYAMLGYILEMIHEKSFGEILRTEIFEPLDMLSSGISEDQLPKVALGYNVNSDGDQELTKLVHHSVSYAAGNILSTTNDMLKFSKALTGGELISQATLDLFTTPIRNGYGLGFIAHNNFNHRYFGHNGGNDGFHANWKNFPEDNLHVVILCNFFSAPFGEIVSTTAAILFDQPFEIPEELVAIELDRKIMDRYIGKFHVTDEMIFNIIWRGDKLAFQATGQDAYTILPYRESDFFLKGSDVTIKFLLDEKDQASALEWNQGGRKDTFHRIEME